MVLTDVNYNKLKTNLRLAINRLKLLEKKKTELAQKARKEIADYIANGKYERAKIRVEHIIREDYIVEAMELVEMYCDLLLARFGLIQQMKTLDDGLAEAISSLIWVAPRIQTDVQELKIIADLLTIKYGKPYAQAVRENALKSVNEKLMIKMGVQAPPKILVEKYLIEIAKSQNVPYEPDNDVLREDEVYCAEEAASHAFPSNDKCLIDFSQNNDNNKNNGGSSGGGFGAAVPFNAPPLPTSPPSAPYPVAPNAANIGFNLPNNSVPSNLPPNYDSVVAPNAKSVNIPPTASEKDPKNEAKPSPSPRSNAKPNTNTLPDLPDIPTFSLPDIPSDNANDSKDDSIDFDDLTKRFEELKKRR